LLILPIVEPQFSLIDPVDVCILVNGKESLFNCIGAIHTHLQLALEQEVGRISRFKCQLNKITFLIEDGIKNIVFVIQFTIVGDRTKKLLIQDKHTFIIYVYRLKDVIQIGLYIMVVYITLIELRFLLTIYNLLIL